MRVTPSELHDALTKANYREIDGDAFTWVFEDDDGHPITIPMRGKYVGQATLEQVRGRCSGVVLSAVA